MSRDRATLFCPECHEWFITRHPPTPATFRGLPLAWHNGYEHATQGEPPLTDFDKWDTMPLSVEAYQAGYARGQSANMSKPD